MIRLGREHIACAADMLARAFFESPENLHGLPDPEHRARKLKYPFRTILMMGVRYGMVYAPSLDLEGVIVLLPYKKYKSITWRFLRCGMRQGIYKLGLGATRRFSIFGKYLFPAHKKHALGPHWYVFTLGVRPERQGQGVGTNLMRYVIDECDRIGMPLYLETELEGNVAFYQALGFDVLEQVQVQVPKTNVTFWFMRRDPSVAGGGE